METVELRVHGVHGTSPGSMLGVSDSQVGQVAGDGLTGIYRVKDGALPYRDLDGTGVSVEAYSWGALTSGIQGLLGWVKRVLWLLLLPFALANLAYWARLEVGQPTAQARWGARAVRLSGLLLTVFFTLTPCVVAIDMVAWQCYRYDVPGCTRIPSQLDFLAGWASAQRLALATFAPMGMLVVLWLLSRSTLARYEDCTDLRDRPPVLASRPVLLHPKLWDGKARTERLQRLHLVTAISTVVGFTGLHVLRADTWPPVVTAATIAAGLLALLASFLVTVSHPDDLENHPGTGFGYAAGEKVRSLPPGFDLGLCFAAVAVYLLLVASLWLDPPSLDQSLDFHGHNLWFIGVFILLTTMHLTIFVGDRLPPVKAICFVVAPVFVGAAVATFLFAKDLYHGWVLGAALAVTLLFWASLTGWHYLTSRTRHRDKAWGGAGASVLLAAAAWVALLFTSSTVIAAANYLNGPNHGVADLVSSVEKDKIAEAPTTYDPSRIRTRPEYVATGDVVVEDAFVTATGESVVVHSGRVRMKGLSLELPDKDAQEVFTEGRGTTIVKRSSTLTIPSGSVTLADSCLSARKDKCTAEEDTFHSAGVLQVPAKLITLDPSDDIVLTPADVPEVPLVVPQVLIWTPMGQLVWVVAVLLGLGVCFGLFRWKVAPRIGTLLDGSPRSPDDQIPKRDRDRCAKMRTTAAFAHRAETLFDVVGAITAPIALVLIVLSMTGQPPWVHAPWTRNVANASMYLVVGLSAALVLLGSQIRRSEKTRKAVGVIWDLTTFWPRAAHPLGPPCYAERVVPELHTRLRWVLDKEATPQNPRPNHIVVSGHSQGSLICAAMVSRLTDEHLARVRMITYGSQIRQLYGRVFPRVLGPDTIGYRPTTGGPSLVDAFPDVPRPLGTVPGPPLPPEDSLRYRLAVTGGTWVNLFRRTDPLGWRVFSDIDSHLDLPVPEVPPQVLGDPGPGVQGHSGYQHTMRYRRRLSLWTGERLVPHPTDTQDATILPPL